MTIEAEWGDWMRKPRRDREKQRIDSHSRNFNNLPFQLAFGLAQSSVFDFEGSGQFKKLPKRDFKGNWLRLHLADEFVGTRCCFHDGFSLPAYWLSRGSLP